MTTSNARFGLRLLELEAALASNISPHSPELVDYEQSRLHGKAARLAMFVRGQDVIDDITRLKKIVASELQIVGADFDATTRLLEEVDLLEDRKHDAANAYSTKKWSG